MTFVRVLGVNGIPCRFFGSTAYERRYDVGSQHLLDWDADMNDTATLDEAEMYRALLQRNDAYDGIFFVAVKTTGIFCRPTCPARKPLRKNVRFFRSAADSIAAGYRACKRCRPMEVSGAMPAWLAELMRQVEAEPRRRWTDEDIRQLDLDPTRVSRWFKSNHGITFHGYLRCRRLAAALAQLSVGDDPTAVAMDAGYESLSGFRDAFQKWFGAPPGRVSGDAEVLMVNRILTPLGPMVAAADRSHLLLLEFADRRMLETQIQRLAKRLRCRYSPGDNAILEQANQEVREYFLGTRQRWTVPIRAPGTEFQQRIWDLLLEIPYGETTSYERLAIAAENPNAQRAVGRANGDNRLAIIIPCHRVVRSDGRLCGYGGGLHRKRWLIDHEAAVRGGEPLLAEKKDLASQPISR